MKNIKSRQKHIVFAFTFFLILLQFDSIFAQVNFASTELLGRPTNQSVTVNIIPDQIVEYYFEYGTNSGALDQRLPTTDFFTSTVNEPIEIEISGLLTNTGYFYRMLYRESGSVNWIARNERSFNTQRTSGSSFKFLVQTDSHMVGPPFIGNHNFYENTLANMNADNADFVMDLGDTFSGDSTSTPAESENNHSVLRSYFDQVGHSAPLFLAVGNHEGESGWIKNNSPPNNYAIWSTNARKKFYPNPTPNDFYSGSSLVHPFINGDGLRENYYAWEWGDALFVVIDPYWYASAFAPSNIWDWTLGQNQYEWLVQELRNSNARYKFVFTHQVISTQGAGRGGIDFIGGEWLADSATFAANRSGWAYDISIHDLLAENNVSVLFHGHDHFFALEELDGVKYQLIPTPSNSRGGEISYPNAIASFPSGGHVRVSVSPSETSVEYVRSSLTGTMNGQIVYSYDVEPQALPSNSKFDFDGDSRTDISVFRPGPNPAQYWLLRSSDGANNAYSFGLGSDKPVPADFTGDGKTDVAFWRESTGEWFILRSEDSSFFGFPFGASGDIPSPGDFDGDGIADAAVYRPSSSTWFIQRSSDGGTTIQGFGVPEDRPTVADYDGDGKDDIAIYRPSVSQWWQFRSQDGTIAYQFGTSGDKTVQGDYTGDGKADVGVFRPSTGQWLILRSEDSSFFGFPFGISTDIPSPGDYDGDGTFDAAVFRPSTNTWFYNGSTSGNVQLNFGIANDIPIPSVYSVE